MQISKQLTQQRSAVVNPWLISTTIFTLVVVWVALTMRWHTALHHDMAEQFVWAHAWQLGYPKHPPLPTWLFMSALSILPAKPATLYALSAVCFGLTGVFTYLAARDLLTPRLALCVACLWSLQQPFSWRAWIYNHNTVLVMCVALTVFCVARASRQGTLRWWAAAGVAAGLAMSTKLQAIVPLLGVLWALWRSGELQQPLARKGVALALLLAVATSAPALWGILAGDTNALSYATHQLGSESANGESTKLASFVVTEIRMLSTALLTLLIWIGWSHRREQTQLPGPQTQGAAHPTRDDKARAWVQGLLFAPLLTALAMGLIGGAKLHGQWGVQTFQFASLALVVWFGFAFQGLNEARILAVTAAAQAMGLAVALNPNSGRLHAQGPVQGYPSAELASKVEQDWRRIAPNCRLRYVSAPFFEGGQLSAFASNFPAVLEDGQPTKSPWIDMTDVANSGSVVMKRTEAELPPDVIHTAEMSLTPPQTVLGVSPVVWGVRAPKKPCAP